MSTVDLLELQRRVVALRDVHRCYVNLELSITAFKSEQAEIKWRGYSDISGHSRDYSTAEAALAQVESELCSPDRLEKQAADFELVARDLRERAARAVAKEGGAL